MELILASTSRYRQALLAQAGITCHVMPPEVDEADLIRQMRSASNTPEEICQCVAAAKARSVADRHPEALVLGSDQLLVLDQELLGKPGTVAAALDQLRRLAGRTHRLLTAFTLIDRRETYSELVTSQMTMRPLSDSEIERYVMADQPLDCAGSYKWESRGVTLFEEVRTPDHTAIVGLPMLSLVTALRARGFAIP